MERKVQEHKQELERLRQATKLDKERLVHEAKLKKEAAGVSGNNQASMFANTLAYCKINAFCNF